MDINLRLQIIGREVTNNYKRQLTRHKDSGRLLSSIKFTTKKLNNSSTVLILSELSYGEFLNKKYNIIQPIIDQNIDKNMDNMVDDLMEEIFNNF